MWPQHDLLYGMSVCLQLSAFPPQHVVSTTDGLCTAPADIPSIIQDLLVLYQLPAEPAVY